MADAESGVCRCRLLIDVLLFIMLTMPLNICEFVIEPQRRGFFCNDDTLQYPYQPASISGATLALVVLLLPLLLIVIVELVSFCHAVKCGKKLQPLLKWSLSSLLWQCSKQFAFYLVGLILTFDIVELAKFTIGRLRPHFMAVCQPQLPDGRTCSDVTLHGRYIKDYECIASGFTAHEVRQIRLSFPSHHTALCIYAMLYLTFYLQNRFDWRGSVLARLSLQLTLLMLATYISLSRIVDHWHHWSDVAVGVIMGVILALINAFYIAKLYEVSTLNVAKRPRQQDQEQLEQTDACIQQEVITTLPAYSK